MIVEMLQTILSRKYSVAKHLYNLFFSMQHHLLAAYKGNISRYRISNVMECCRLNRIDWLYPIGDSVNRKRLFMTLYRLSVNHRESSQTYRKLVYCIANHGFCQFIPYYCHVLHELYLIGAIILDLAMSSELFNHKLNLISIKWTVNNVILKNN